MPTELIEIDDSSHSVSYQPHSWQRETGVVECDGTRHASNVGQNGAIACLGFAGTAVRVVGTLGESATFGQPKTVYSIDNVVAGFYDAPFVPEGETRYNVTFFEISGLSPEDHMLLINSTDGTPPNQFLLDYFVITPLGNLASARPTFLPVEATLPGPLPSSASLSVIQSTPTSSSTTLASSIILVVTTTTTIVSTVSPPTAGIQVHTIPSAPMLTNGASRSQPSVVGSRRPRSSIHKTTSNSATLASSTIFSVTAPVGASTSPPAAGTQAPIPSTTVSTDGVSRSQPQAPLPVRNSQAHATIIIVSATVTGIFVVAVFLFCLRRFRRNAVQVVPFTHSEGRAVDVAHTKLSPRSSASPSIRTVEATERPNSLAVSSIRSLENNTHSTTSNIHVDTLNLSSSPYSLTSPAPLLASTTSLIHAEFFPPGEWYAPPETPSREHARGVLRAWLARGSASIHRLAGASYAVRDVDSGLRLYGDPAMPPEYTRD
ncbi:hypothetical protein C2E23DRAFT_883383 [Lenzites betulinus]|nr:hypothetical protein C2E23DRAFT_883383 [Lenzites betulinus]